MQRLLHHRREPWPAGSLTIGRLPGSDISVDDALVSRVHALLVPTAAGLEIQDNESSNGTFVNGYRVDRVLLREGDIVTVGNTDFAVSDNTLVPRPAAAGGGVQAYRLALTIEGHQRLTDVSFTARPGTLTAVVGPFGAGKTGLVQLLSGAARPSCGVVALNGYNVHADHALVRSRIGMVPQDDVVHRQLTIEQALGYAAELRLPSDTSAAERRRVVNQVIDELELSTQRTTRADELSHGDRKRASVAMELLTGPSLLILDEPAFRQNRPLSDEVMKMARGLADAGRVVVVVTHSRNYLHLCDQVVLLTSAGKTAFVGPPQQVKSAMGTTYWADILARVGTDPDGAHDAFLARQSASASPAQRPTFCVGPRGSQAGTPRRRQIHGSARPQARPRASATQWRRAAVSQALTSRWRQIISVARRQARVVVADRSYFVFLTMLPFLFGLLALAVVGLSGDNPYGEGTDKALPTVVVLNIAAVFMGTALSIRDLAGERAVFRYEQSVGLSASAYLAARTIVFSVATIIQTAILIAIVVVGKHTFAHGAVLHGTSVAELYLTVVTTAVMASIVGLGVSSLAKHTRRTLPMFVAIVIGSLVLCGGMFPLAG